MTPLDLQTWKSRLAGARSATLSTEPPSAPSLCATLDQLVVSLADGSGWATRGRAVVALGGYGRTEMAPHSDVDLLFLVVRNTCDAPVNGVLYPLWDLGLEVGHAVRTPRDCRDLARSDLTAATALMDARWLIGDRDLLEKTLHGAGIRDRPTRATRGWVAGIVADVADRRARFGEISHLLEPHVKEGRGGLRDFQACRWLLRCLGADPARRLEAVHGGPAAGAAVDFLFRVRNALHVAAGRKTDHLTFELHRDVVAHLPEVDGVEELFARIHHSAHTISGCWDTLAAQIQIGPWSRWSLDSPPNRVPCLTTGEPLSPETRVALTRLPADVRRSAVLEGARDLLRSRRPLAPLLHDLHGLGFLSDVAPEVATVAHLVPYDARHRFPVGVHCIETMARAEDLWRGARTDDEPRLSEVAGRLLAPAVLRVAALGHDLGKGVSADHHATAGAEIVRTLGTRLGLETEEIAEAVWLTEHHHLLSELAFGRDLEDPGTGEVARKSAGSPERLDALLVLTYADLAATRPSPGPASWTDWTRALLLTLYDATFHPPEKRPEFLEQRRAAVAARLAREGVSADLPAVPSSEWLQVPPDLMSHLIRLGSAPTVETGAWELVAGPDGPLEVLGACAAAPRLLSATTGALTRLGFDILSLQAHSWPTGIVHLWFRVRPGGSEPSPGRVVEALGQAVSLDEPYCLERHLANPREEAMPVETRVSLKPGSPFHSVLEVRCRDHKGLLAALTRAFDDLGLTVPYALVTTHGPMARDLFHLKDIFGGRLEARDKRRALVKTVSAIIGEAPPTPRRVP